MVTTYNLRHPNSVAGPATGPAPWVYFTASKVTIPETNQIVRIPRPNVDVRMRRRATMERKLTVIVDLVASPDTGVDTGAGPTGDGNLMLETLETALTTWNQSGAVRIQVGLKSDASARTYDGLIENITFDWVPGHDDATPIRRATINMIIGTVQAS